MSVKEKTQELVSEIKETEEYQQLHSAENRVKLDPEASDIMEKIQSVQQDIQTTQAQGGQISPETIEEYKVLERQAKSNLTLSNYAKAQEAFGGVMQQISDDISQGLSSTS